MALDINIECTLRRYPFFLPPVAQVLSLPALALTALALPALALPALALPALALPALALMQ